MEIYLELPKYLKEWCEHQFGDDQGVVSFPRGSAENDVLKMTLTIAPKKAIAPDWGLRISVPEFKSKPSKTYNWLTHSAREMLAHVIMTRFRVKVWHDLYNIQKLSLPVVPTIEDWAQRNGITCEPKSIETIRQMYYRQRKRYRVDYIGANIKVG